MALMKLIISYFIIALMEWSMEGKWETENSSYCFEISMAVLCAGWIAHQGW